MKRNLLNAFYSFVMFLFITVSAYAQIDRKVAVFDPAGTVEKSLLEIVREEISSVVVNTKGYTVLERQLINKVLEENKFQESGLVNDDQVSDIGKRMGADYVFVTAISKLGDNYYISCKMIEVATARIDKQFTGTSTDGINDIPQTTQYIVKRLFGENVQQQVFNRQRQQTPVQTTPTQKETPPPTRQTDDIYTTQRNVATDNRQTVTTDNNRASSYTGHLVANRMNVYASGRALRQSEIRAMMYGTEALQYYNKGIRKHRGGKALVAVGWSVFGLGALIEIATSSEEGMFIGAGLSVGVVGLAALGIPGAALKGGARRNVSKAVQVYNSGGYGYVEPQPLYRIDFGITSNGGIGIAMTF